MPRHRRNGREAHGFVLGKFMPPHEGHRYLVDFACSFACDVTVVVGSLASEPIPGEARWRWMKDAFPGCTVLHLAEELPQDPSETPEFWKLWREALLGILPRPVDLVFASESYGFRLAEELGARFVPVDISRRLIPVSASAIRKDPLRHWSFILPEARAELAWRVCISGPESTGKTSLARALAERYDSVYVPEYARSLIAAKGRELDERDFMDIAAGQKASEAFLAKLSGPVLFCDTSVLESLLWYEYFFGERPGWLVDELRSSGYDLYLLCEPDIPWKGDYARFDAAGSRRFLEGCTDLLEELGRPYVKVGGKPCERLDRACAAVDELLARGLRCPGGDERRSSTGGFDVLPGRPGAGSDGRAG